MASRRPNIEINRPVVWITGASRGIGREIAKGFAAIGCHVCVSGRTLNSLNPVAREIIRDGGIASVVLCNVSSSASVAAAARRIREQTGDVEVLVNVAGITVFKDFLATTLDEFDEIIDTNLRGQIACIKSVLPSMVKRKRGWIINILSTASVKTFEGSAAYTATKSGLLGLAKVLREEMRRYNIKVVNVIPGPTETGMWMADRKSTRLNSSHIQKSRMPSSA